MVSKDVCATGPCILNDPHFQKCSSYNQKMIYKRLILIIYKLQFDSWIVIFWIKILQGLFKSHDEIMHSLKNADWHHM